MASPPGLIAPLTTVFTPPPECQDRYAVFIATPTPIGVPYTNAPSSGWIDPSFSSCVPSQYTNTFPTFSPGVCPSQMEIVSTSSTIKNGQTTWMGACCQSGFSTMELDPRYYCTSSVTTPMEFLLDPNITTADVPVTLADLWIEHDQITVQWQEKDLTVLPKDVADQYSSYMGIIPKTVHTSEVMSNTQSFSITSLSPTYPASETSSPSPSSSSAATTSTSSTSMSTSMEPTTSVESTTIGGHTVPLSITQVTSTSLTIATTLQIDTRTPSMVSQSSSTVTTTTPPETLAPGTKSRAATSPILSFKLLGCVIFLSVGLAWM